MSCVFRVAAGQHADPLTGLAHGEPAEHPFTPAAILTHASPELLPAVALLVVAALYLYGVYRLHARGDRWPVGRTVLFVGLGLGTIAVATLSGIGAYDTTLLSAHMVQHMLLSMVGPIFLALGAPVTLALRTLPGRPRRLLLTVLHSRLGKLVTFPVLTFGLFIANPFALYFTSLYRLTLTNDAVHQLLHAHFLITGCLFFWPLIGLDPVPWRLQYPLRALIMFLSTPFHAVLGLTVMQSRTLLAGDYYPSLGLDWADPATDQRLAGGILWAAGELVSILMLGALVVQWMRAADREAARLDRQLDREEAAAARSAGADHHQTDQSGADQSGADRPEADVGPAGTIRRS